MGQADGGRFRERHTLVKKGKVQVRVRDLGSPLDKAGYPRRDQAAKCFAKGCSLQTPPDMLNFCTLEKTRKEAESPDKKDTTALSRKYKPKEDPLIHIGQALNTFFQQNLNMPKSLRIPVTGGWYHPVESS